ncbi:TonB-dependent receptor [Ochrovirga pacifica]|uniref:TonB-dependent receptor n=1 Tax=Ochrovirga pacifica TaxID=1042376 RepID=UPI0002559514|nr:TonB-dependent receptor [Ochrovirga pacifica]
MKFKYLIILQLFFSAVLFGQTKTIKGTVVTFKEYPLNQVKIKSGKTKNVVFTDSLGRFQIRIKDKDELHFYADGFFKEKRTVELPLEKDLTVNMYYDENSKRSFTKATKSLHVAKKILKHALEYKRAQNNFLETLPSIYDIIQYKYPGAKLMDLDGTTQVLLNARGENSIFADIHALLVIDGIVVNDISGVMPMEVKNVRVLLGNQAGHWGMRGGNGVIEIDLKYGP